MCQFAANLLRYHHYAITQAAQAVGIPDVPYFTRLFKRTMGETPSQYARKKAIES
ncbi:MAG: AraC family transcriptional regulator [Gemmiger sp.]